MNKIKQFYIGIDGLKCKILTCKKMLKQLQLRENMMIQLREIKNIDYLYRVLKKIIYIISIIKQIY